jgi:pimeloyl-ACP methyl ester carboxylesterase
MVRSSNQFREREISTSLGGVHMRYKRRRGQLDLVLVHGLIVCSTFMEPTATCLSKRNSVYLPDLLGHGQSETPEAAVTIVEHANSMIEALTKLKVKSPVIIGGSYGCHVAVEMANKMDAQALVFVGPTPGDKLAKSFVDLSTDALREPPELVLKVLLEIARISPPRVIELLDDMANYPFHERLRKLRKIPTLVITGENDPFFQPDFMDGTAQALRNCRGICMPKAAHGLPFSEPEVISEFIENFLGDHFQTEEVA